MVRVTQIRTCGILGFAASLRLREKYRAKITARNFSLPQR